MADQLQNSTANAAIIPEVWSARYYEVLKANLAFNSLISRNYEGEIRAMGDVLKISSIPEFSQASLLAEGAAGDAEAVVVTSQDLTINSMAFKDVIVTKQADLQSLPFMDDVRDNIIYSIMKKMQADIIAAIVPSASNPDHVLAYTSGTTMALTDILSAKEALDTANVPMENRQVVMGAAQLNDCFAISGFVSRDFIPAGSPLTSGVIATPLCGFTVNTTTVVGNTSYFFHPSFMTMAVQEDMTIELFNMGVNGVRATRVNGHSLYGIKQLDNKRIVTIA